MSNHNLLLAALDLLLALVIVFIAYFAVTKYSNTAETTVTAVDEILKLEILEDYPELNKDRLNYVAFYVLSDRIQIVDIINGDNKNDTTISNSIEIVDWFYSNLDYLRKNKKNLAIYEAETNSNAVSTLLRLATKNEIRIGYADVRD